MARRYSAISGQSCTYQVLPSHGRPPSARRSRRAPERLHDYRERNDGHDKNLGYDVTSLDVESGELRLIGGQGSSRCHGHDPAHTQRAPSSRRTAVTATGCTWLTNCASAPELREPLKDPARFPWHEVSKVQHYYWLEVDAMTQPMRVRQERASYGDGGKRE